MCGALEKEEEGIAARACVRPFVDLCAVDCALSIDAAIGKRDAILAR